MVPIQQPRPLLISAATGKKALRVVAAHADVWVCSDGGESEIRERSRLLDEYCREIGRDPGLVERAYLHIGGEVPPAPFVSSDAFQEFVGRYREAGIQRFMFLYMSAAAPASWDAGVAAGAWASRKALEAFAAQEIKDIQESQSGC